MKFMLMMHAPMGSGDWNLAQWTPEEQKAMFGFMTALNKDLKDRGELAAAEGLDIPANARLVRAGKGAPAVTDGPFAEAKEFLAGFWIVEVPTPERAYEIAAKVSSCPGPGGQPLNMAVEVRQVMSGPPEQK